MAKRKSKWQKTHDFRNKLILNQWLISLFGIDPFIEESKDGKRIQPFRKLAEPIQFSPLEGLGKDNLHNFYHYLGNSPLFSYTDPSAYHPGFRIDKDMLLIYEQNIVRHTQTINEKRRRPVIWKYYQWLTLLFVEIYLDRFFSDRKGLLNELNDFVGRFNSHWRDYVDVPLYDEDDLNKLCLQNATGSGKTLLMHVNLLQYRHYAKKHGKDKDLSRVILITPNERLSEQHIAEFRESNISADSYLQARGSLFGQESGLTHVDVLEITKLADQEGPNTIATRSLGDQNLLLVDEGHRGMSGKETGVWFQRRTDLCAKGFTFEYSATFEQAVKASGNPDFEDSYAKTILFDYSYRWFYEDGFGKDYQILNLPESFEEVRAIYMTACLLKYYQQLYIYEENIRELKPFNLEKPLWVFVGNTVSKGKMTRDEEDVATDVGEIILFIADFLDNEQIAKQRMKKILGGTGRDTGLLDIKENDIFAGAFTYLHEMMKSNKTVEDIYQDILSRLFNHSPGGHLSLDRIKGESGEIALHVGTSDTPFGLINVGDAKGLCDHVEKMAVQRKAKLTVNDTDFTEAMFASVKESSSPINLLIGSKKFVEGWDCWRVSTMGLMHVGRSEGAQIIQLFGRGVRLKGYEWSLKRSGHTQALNKPPFINELEILNVFGVEADFMEKFHDFLKEEGLPGNERRETITIPLNVTYDFGKKLKILRPKRKTFDGKEYDFKKDAPIPAVGNVPDYMKRNTVVADWYPRIAAMRSSGKTPLTEKSDVRLAKKHLAFLDYDALYFELERFKRERSWYNLNITKDGIKGLLERSDWYTLKLPESYLAPENFDGVRLLQQVVTELLKRYCDLYYNYCKREFFEPRLELYELASDDNNIPQENFYQLIVDGNEIELVNAILQIKKDLELNKDKLLEVSGLRAMNFDKHIFQPLFHVRQSGKITVMPVSLNEGEYEFVCDLKAWCDKNKAKLEKEGKELYLLRNMSRGKGVGFFEAGGFYPDFILWTLVDDKQYVTFIEPHGLIHEGPASAKIEFRNRIKDIERRLNDPKVILNSFILSRTKQAELKWHETKEDLADLHVLFMKDDPESYIDQLFDRLYQNA